MLGTKIDTNKQHKHPLEVTLPDRWCQVQLHDRKCQVENFMKQNKN
jgi:hypothetical protein